MGYDETETVKLTESQENIKNKLIRKSGARYIDDALIVFADGNIDANDDSGKIALKCTDCIFCIRDHMDYAHYKISDRSDCPSSCSLNI